VYAAFFRMANGGTSGPLSTVAAKAFSQIGLALLINSAGETVGVGPAVCVAGGAGVIVTVGSEVSLGEKVDVGTIAEAG